MDSTKPDSGTGSTTQLISRAAAAEMLGVGIPTLEAWAYRGKPALPYVRIGAKAMYRLSEIEKFINDRTGTSATEIRHALAQA